VSFGIGGLGEMMLVIILPSLMKFEVFTLQL